MSDPNKDLAAALIRVAEAIAATPVTIIGSQVTLRAEPGMRGNIIGKQITITAGPGTGNIIGESITIDSSAADAVAAERKQLIIELRDAAKAVSQTGPKAPKSWIESLLSRAGKIGERLVDGAVGAAAAAATTYYLGKSD